MLGGGIGFVGSGISNRNAHIFSKSSRKVFEKSSAAGTKEILQVTQNERKCKIFFLLCPNFGHSLATFSTNEMKKGMSFDTPLTLSVKKH